MIRCYRPLPLSCHRGASQWGVCERGAMGRRAVEASRGHTLLGEGPHTHAPRLAATHYWPTPQAAQPYASSSVCGDP
eukprot:scaffold87606_cov62-Phaeocystis_antarctica.AAC.1